MAAITLGEILEHVDQFERILRDFYTKLSKETTHEGARLVTEYMSRHSLHIRQLLENLPPERMSSLCSTPLPYRPHFPGKECIDLVNLPSDPTANEVLDASIQFDECLVRMYHSVEEQPVSQEIKDFFGSLIRRLHRDEIELKKVKAMDYF